MDNKNDTCRPINGDCNNKDQSQNCGVSSVKRESNRANSRRSTGPKTARGKSVSRFNALKHGANIKDLFILEGKHLKEYARFQQLSDQLQAQMSPGAYLEDKVLIQSFIMAAWRLERLYRLDLIADVDGAAAAIPELFPAAARHFPPAVRNLEHAYDRLQALRQRVEDLEASEDEAGAVDACAGAHATATESDGARAPDVPNDNIAPEAGKAPSDNGRGTRELHKVTPSDKVN